MRGGGMDVSSSYVQGSHPYPMIASAGYSNAHMMMPNSPSQAWQPHLIPKQEPMDEDRNDSGFNSSPGSDRSQEQVHPPFYSQMPKYAYNMSFPISSSPNPEHQNMLQNAPNMVMTPQPSPTSSSSSGEPKTPNSAEEPNQDHLSKLERAMEKNNFMSPKSLNMTENEPVDDLEEDIKTPKMNSHGKVKKYKCKQCDFVATTKLSFWTHSGEHIKSDRRLECTKCPFVTEYKHHLEYHMRNHTGSKPFKCNECDYSCVNKSMLNSHKKSHSNVYQYRCADCNYVSKYCHSLKLHLRKYLHQPAMVLNADGTPNPLPIIDVYGTRRGPKQKTSMMPTMMEPQLQHQINNNNQQVSPQQQNLPSTPIMNGFGQQIIPFPYPFIPPTFNNLFTKLPPQMAEQSSVDDVDEEDIKEDDEKMEEQQQIKSNPLKILDLSKQISTTKNRRKGKAFKLDRAALQHYNGQSDSEEVPEPVAPAVVVPNPPKEVERVQPQPQPEEDLRCKFCLMSFGDAVLHTMHMGYHGFKDPFTCNMCGDQCNDRLSFNNHIARKQHA
ncbi:PREDICTED: protein hunchback [Nicrophorus vespilloides]|uniref:Protein hunchback n=1 Tax=Nicrophorus vespilloides TaxID=110193 RepID=A0ABM1MRM4_NICVS|nr:PREDICTED: protein hunchback [Nicrophorus vespilloides]